MSFISLDKVYKRYKTGTVTIEAASSMSFDIEKGEMKDGPKPYISKYQELE